MSISIGRDRQREIYLNGFSGNKSKIPFDSSELERLAKAKLSKNAFGYIATGAGTNHGIQNNLNAFDKYCIIPRMLRGNDAAPIIHSEILNTRLPFPFLFAPIGVLSLAHPHGDCELAKASRFTGVPMIHSNQASCSMEECRTVLGNTDSWFQLYFSKSKDLVESLVNRAAASGNKAIVLTLDTTILGWRNMDLQNGYLPFLRGLGIAQYTSDPVFKGLMKNAPAASPDKKLPGLFDLITLMKSYPDSFINNLKTQNPVKAVRTFLDVFSRPELSWDDVQWLKSITRLPVLLKGILHPDDARRALDYGIDGIIISNHGGRQIDRVTSTLDALIEIKKGVPENYPLLMDGGIRKGADVFIALALGAKAICLGRSYAYALAIGGHAAVTEYVQNMASELQIMMSLTGCKSLEEIPGHVVRKSP